MRACSTLRFSCKHKAVLALAGVFVEARSSEGLVGVWLSTKLCGVVFVRYTAGCYMSKQAAVQRRSNFFGPLRHKVGVANLLCD